MVVEFARNELGINEASEEFGEGNQVLLVKQMPDQEGLDQKGGTMRLGSYSAKVQGKVSEKLLYTRNNRETSTQI